MLLISSLPPPAQLCSSPWQMAEPCLSQVAAPGAAPGALPRGLGPPGLPLVYASLHTHLLKQANSAPANMGYGIDCVSCSYVSFTKEVSLQNIQVCFEVSCPSFEALHLLFACCWCDTMTIERAARQKHVHKDTQEVPYHLFVNNFPKWECSFYNRPFQVK